MKKNRIIVGTLMIFILSTSLLVFLTRDTKLYSRKVMELAENLVMEDMTFSPPGAARTYASVSTLYFRVLDQTGNTQEAVVASTQLLKRKYTEQSQQFKFDRFLLSINVDGNQTLSATTTNLLESEWANLSSTTFL
jgi:hypothetical protein